MQLSVGRAAGDKFLEQRGWGMNFFNVDNEVWCQWKSGVISNVYNGRSLGKLVVSHLQVTSSTGEVQKCHCYLWEEKI